MSMTAWWNIFTNSLWILGLAAALATLGYADWLVSTGGQGPRGLAAYLLRSPTLALALALACLGVGLGIPQWWERGLWVLLSIGFVLQAVRVWVNQRKGLPQSE
jgi:hypothetical protein